MPLFCGHIQTRILAVMTILFVITPLKFRANTMENSYVDSLCLSLNNMPDNKDKLEVLKKIYYQHKTIDTVAKYSLYAYKLALKLTDTLFASDAIDVFAWSQYTLDKYEISKEYYKKAIKLHSQIGDEIGKANSIMCLGNVYFALNNYDLGLDYAMDALKIFSDKNDTAHIGMVYRGLAKSCLDYQIYKTSKEYFFKALTIDSLTLNIRSIGRDYYGIALTMFSDCNIKDTLTMKASNEYFKKAIPFSEQNADYMYMVYEYFYLSMQYAILTAVSSNWNYSDSSMYYYKECQKMISRINYNEYSQNTKLLKAQHSILFGNYLEAYSILNEYSQKTNLDNQTKKQLSKVFSMFYFCTKNYKKWLDYIYQEELLRKQHYISEYGVKLDVKTSNTDNEIFLNRFDGNLQENYQNFLKTKEKDNLLKKIWMTITIGSIMIVCVLIYNYIKDLKRNKLLQKQKEEIILTNTELDKKNIEILSQSYELETQMHEILSQTKLLYRANNEIIENLEIAGRLQQSVLPDEDFIKSLFNKIFILFKPLDIVSGDFYWAKIIGDFKYIAVADCTGHGVPGACLSMFGISLLNAITVSNETLITDSAVILNKMRKQLAEAFLKGASEEDFHDGMDIALCIINQKERKLSFSGAYRPLWIIEDEKLREIKADRMPIALDKDHTNDFSSTEISLSGKETIYMFSDGITDQFGEKEPGKLSKFQSKRLKELIIKNHKKTPETQKMVFEKEIQLWAGDQSQTDDILIIGFSEIVPQI